MKKKFSKLTLILFIMFLFFSIFTKTDVVISSIEFSINVFLKNIFPSLFPMFILTSILSSIGLPKLLGNIFNKLCVFLFKTKGIVAFVFISSMLSGFPSSGKLINELLEKKEINEVDASKFLNFTFLANPLFVINTVGLMFLNNKKIGIIIYICHVVGNIVVGLLFRNLYNQEETKKDINIRKSIINFYKNISSEKIIKDFLESISKTLLTLLNVFGIITCFIVLLNFIDININPLFNSIFKGIIEQTTGLKYLSLTDIPYKIKVYASTFLISFGGFSIHAQIFNILSKYKIKYYPFLLARFIHALISVLLIFFMINL